MTNYYRTREQKQAIAKKIQEAGWTFRCDSWEITGKMTGWWTHSETHPRATGDAVEFYYGAEVIFDLYTDMTDADIEVTPEWMKVYAVA